MIEFNINRLAGFVEAIAIIILWINDIYWNKATSMDVAKKNLISRLVITFVAEIIFVFTDWPIIRDKSIIDFKDARFFYELVCWKNKK